MDTTSATRGRHGGGVIELGFIMSSRLIEETPGVCGGHATVVRTRVPIWVFEQARRSGATDAEPLRAYTTLRAEDLAEAWAYVRSHLDEVEQAIRDNEAA